MFNYLTHVTIQREIPTEFKNKVAEAENKNRQLKNQLASEYQKIRLMATEEGLKNSEEWKLYSSQIASLQEKSEGHLKALRQIIEDNDYAVQVQLEDMNNVMKQYEAFAEEILNLEKSLK